MRRNRWPGSAKISELRGAGVSGLDRDSEGGGSAMRCSRLTPVIEWSAIEWECVPLRVRRTVR